MSKQAFIKKAERRNRRYILDVYKALFVFIGGGLKRQRIGKLDRNTP